MGLFTKGKQLSVGIENVAIIGQAGSPAAAFCPTSDWTGTCCKKTLTGQGVVVKSLHLCVNNLLRRESSSSWLGGGTQASNHETEAEARGLAAAPRGQSNLVPKGSQCLLSNS